MWFQYTYFYAPSTERDAEKRKERRGEEKRWMNEKGERGREQNRIARSIHSDVVLK
jgi:signal transduction histidine kinase